MIAGDDLGIILLTWLIFNPIMEKSKYIHYNVWGEITYPFPNFNRIRWSLGVDK